MKKYVVIIRWHDLKDGNYQYQPGDVYPREGLKPTKKRFEELSTTSNRRKTCLIKEVEETQKTKSPKNLKKDEDEK